MKGSQLLSDFFIQKKMSLPEKESVWLLCSGDDIVWILNHRIHNDYRLRPETEQALSIQLI
jgi:tRNA(Ile)-lysidine synthase